MLPEEFAGWLEFYRQNPFDDFHRFVRPAALAASVGTPDMLDKAIGFLAALDPRTPAPAASTGRYSEADIKTMRALGFNVKG